MIVNTSNYHFTLSAQYAADVLPRFMFLACLALNDLRLALSEEESEEEDLPSPLTPC